MLASVLLASAAIFHGTPAELPAFASLDAGGQFCGGAADRARPRAHRRPLRPGRRPEPVRRRSSAAARAPPRASTSRRSTGSSRARSRRTSQRVGARSRHRGDRPREPVTDVPPLPSPPPRRPTASRPRRSGAARPAPDSDVEQPRAPPARRRRRPRPARPTTSALLHPSLHLCTQDPTPNKSQSCPGDSGSPVMVTRDGVLQVVGVVSWGGETHVRATAARARRTCSERVLPHLALLTGALPARTAPYPTRARGSPARAATGGRWRPRGRAVRAPLQAPQRGGRVCVVTARTAGGWTSSQRAGRAALELAWNARRPSVRSSVSNGP